MEELRKEVDAIYRMISSLSVSGDAVDIIAAVRAKLKRVHGELAKLDVKSEGAHEE